MTEAEEQAYIEGRKSAYRSLMGMIASELGFLAGEADAATAHALRLSRERRDAIVALRHMCEDLGVSVTWTDDLNLADIIEKHVHRTVKLEYWNP